MNRASGGILPHLPLLLFLPVAASVTLVPCDPTSLQGAGTYYDCSVQPCVNGYVCSCPRSTRATSTKRVYAWGGTTQIDTVLSCETCPPGTWAPNYNTLTSCNSCVAPRVITSARDNCVCDKGYYSSQAGSQCTPCEAGKYQPNPGQTSCILCPAGQYNSQSGLAFCKTCGPGIVSDFTRTQCQCDVGFYHLSSYCVECENGYRCVGDGTRELCRGELGNWSPSGSGTCRYCGPGFYLNPSNVYDGLPACEVCPPGYYCLGTIKYRCNLGRYQPESGATSCLMCAGNQWSGYDPAPECQTCGPGSVIRSFDSTGWFECYASCPVLNAGCDLCPAGYMCPDGMEKMACNAGQYQADLGQVDCLDCAIGNNWYTPMDDVARSECLECPPGNYISNSPPRDCTICPAGLSCDGTEQKYLCYAGTYSSQQGASSCTACPPGHVSPSSEEKGQIQCTKCPNGTVADDTHTICVECVGKIACPDGIRMLPCNNGTYSLDRSSQCTQCPAGKYTPLTDSSDMFSSMEAVAERGFQECLSCPPQGYYSLSGASECLRCTAGFCCINGIRTMATVNRAC